MTKAKTPMEFKDAVHEVKTNWDEFHTGKRTTTTIIAGDYNIDIWTEQGHERAIAIKELLARMSINTTDLDTLEKAPWVCRGPPGRRKTYDHVFCSKPNEHQGAPACILQRGYHRSVCMRIISDESYIITLSGSRPDSHPDPMRSWMPAKAAQQEIERMKGQGHIANMRIAIANTAVSRGARAAGTHAGLERAGFSRHRRRGHTFAPRQPERAQEAQGR